MPLKKDLGQWISHFEKSDAPQFKDKSKEERKDMALAAFRAKYGSLNEAYENTTNLELASYVGVLQNEIGAEKNPKKLAMLKQDLEDVKNELKKRKSVNEDFAKFDTLKMAINQHEKGEPYYDKTRLINIFNQLDNPDQERAKKEYSEYFGKSVNESNGFKSGKDFINIKLKNYPKAIAKVNQLVDMIGEDKFTMEMAEWIFDFFNNAHFESPINEAKSISDYKVGDKVTYLGHPGEITKVNKEMTGAITYNVAYDKGDGRTKANNLSNKGGEIKLAEATKDEETTFHKKLDKLVHDTFGKRKGELEEKAMKKVKEVVVTDDAEKAEDIANKTGEEVKVVKKGTIQEGREYDYEGKMAQAQLLSIVKNSRDLFNMIGKDDQLKSWVQSKLTKAEDYLDSVRTYLEGESLTSTAPVVVQEDRVRDEEGTNLNIGDVVKAGDGRIYQIIFSYSENKPFLVPFDLKRRKPTTLRSKVYFDSEDLITKKLNKIMDYSATKGGFMK
jgi:hypothetical protein